MFILDYILHWQIMTSSKLDGLFTRLNHCRGREGCHLITLPSSGRTVLYESPLSPARYREAFQLVQEAAVRGDNIGSDEFPTYEYFHSHLLDLAVTSACVLGIDGTSTGNDVSKYEGARMSGIVIITPCRYARSSHPILCSLTIVASRDFADDDKIWQDLIEIGTTAASRCGPSTAKVSMGEQEVGSYNACVVDVFVVCLRQLTAYREAGFMITASIPNAGKLTGLRGRADSYILYKEFSSSMVSLSRCAYTTWTCRGVLCKIQFFRIEK
jgi:hypothetical protein